MGQSLFLSGEQPTLNSENTDAAAQKKEPKSIAYKAGAMIGQAIDFGIVQTVSHKIPFIKALGSTGASMSAAFTMGFLSGHTADSGQPTENGLKSRLMSGLLPP